ncbi:hypothetical protein [Actinomadura alba]|uniref:hypothetical protein n=1 Tax=Actinomadura alba TaxID=406431 RepID=UPI0031DC4414
MAAAMQTLDGAWRVEPYLRPQTRGSWWYRLVDPAHDSVIEDLSITGTNPSGKWGCPTTRPRVCWPSWTP